MMEPRLILLDEPAGGINPSLVERLSGMIRDLNEQGVSFLVVEHNIPMVLELCDPVYVFARGTSISQGSPDVVRNDPAVLDAYLGDEWKSEPDRVGDLDRCRPRRCTVLRMTNIWAGYGGSHVLQGVDLHCAPGTITCIVGPNGAGKSTVLRVVSGLLSPSEGSVDLDGTPIAGRAPDAILRAGVAQVPQSHALFPQMTVRENVMLGGYTIRRDKDLLHQRFREVSELVPIVADRSEQHAGNLSGGQRRWSRSRAA